jgi:hypothetical protein
MFNTIIVIWLLLLSWWVFSHAHINDNISRDMKKLFNNVNDLIRGHQNLYEKIDSIDDKIKKTRG